MGEHGMKRKFNGKGVKVLKTIIALAFVLMIAISNFSIANQNVEVAVESISDIDIVLGREKTTWGSVEGLATKIKAELINQGIMTQEQINNNKLNMYVGNKEANVVSDGNATTILNNWSKKYYNYTGDANFYTGNLGQIAYSGSEGNTSYFSVSGNKITAKASSTSTINLRYAKFI